MSLHRIIADPKLAGMRLDVFVTHRLAAELQDRGLSRSGIQRLIDRGRITVNGQRAKRSARLKARDVVEIEWLPAEDSHLAAERFPLCVLYEDEDCLVIDKPAGLVVHPAAGHAAGTLVNALLHLYPALEGVGGERRPGIVHRLDKETSGVMIVAKNNFAYQKLARQFKDRAVAKEYLALVWGKMTATYGIIDRPIGRHSADRKRMSSIRALAKKRPAVTEWKVENSFFMDSHGEGAQWVTLLRIKPRTGRTHQIRVHLADLGHPVIGDKVYGRKRGRGKGSLKGAFLNSFPRHALHAERLEIRHPRSGARMTFSAPLPDDMAELLKDLSAAEASSQRRQATCG